MTCGTTTIGNKPLLSLGFSRIIDLSGPGTSKESAPTHKAKTMKEGIHPNYREVVFLDTSCDFGFVTRSTVATNETIKWKDGKEYPVYKIEISAESHPFYTGKQKIVDTAGRVDKFKKRYARKSSAKAAG
jgi:large subunit ribosomal protein L31